MRAGRATTGLGLLLALVMVAAGCGGGGGAKVTPESARFTDRGYGVHFSPTGTYSFGSIEEGGKYSVFPRYTIDQWFDTGDVGLSLVEEVTLKSVRVTQQPKFGTISFEIEHTGARSWGEDFVTWTGYGMQEAAASIRLFLTSSPLGDHVLGKDFSGTHSGPQAFRDFVAGAGLKSADLRFKIRYRLEIVKDGKRYFSDKEVVILPGDFLNEGGPNYDYEMAEPFKTE
ncbi:MAG: hypothetical protein RDU89_11935 [bacterium]|nr:hypothetical protein [bacterium]